MSFEKRLGRLEGRCPRQLTIEEMSSDELAEIVTGIPGARFEDLTVEYLEGIIGGECDGD